MAARRSRAGAAGLRVCSKGVSTAGSSAFRGRNIVVEGCSHYDGGARAFVKIRSTRRAVLCGSKIAGAKLEVFMECLFQCF